MQNKAESRIFPLGRKRAVKSVPRIIEEDIEHEKLDLLDESVLYPQH